MIKVPDALVLNLVASACHATLGPGDLAMPARLLVVAWVYNWASFSLAGKAEYARERWERCMATQTRARRQGARE